MLAVAGVIAGRLLRDVEDFALSEQIGGLVVGEGVGVGVGGATAAGKAIVGGGAKGATTGVGFGGQRSQSLGVFGRLAVVHDNAGVFWAKIRRLATAGTGAANENVAGEREALVGRQQLGGDRAQM